MLLNRQQPIQLDDQIVKGILGVYGHNIYVLALFSVVVDLERVDSTIGVIPVYRITDVWDVASQSAIKNGFNAFQWHRQALLLSLLCYSFTPIYVRHSIDQRIPMIRLRA